MSNITKKFNLSNLFADLKMSSSPGSLPRRTSLVKRFSRSLSADPDVPIPVLCVRRYHTNAYEYISEALKIEELGGNIEEKVKAHDLYTKGVHELERGIAVDTTADGLEWQRARTLQSKMQANLHYCVSRIEELGIFIESLKEVSKKDDSSVKDQPMTDESKNKIEKITDKRKASLPNLKPPLFKGARENKLTPGKQFPKHIKSVAPGIPKTSGLSPKGIQPNGNIKVTRIPPRRTPTKTKQPVKSTGVDNDATSKKLSNLKNVDKKMAHTILNEVVESGPGVSFNDIGGVENAKRTLREIVILPSMRPELFTGLRAPARGVLLFGPPGNGKTLLAKAVATEANSVFFNISASSLTSKWMGESEKMVRALFAVARELKPSIIFMDEVDSILKERSESEHESSRRLKTEFLLCFDGVVTDNSERFLIMAATNRPWELDDAALRRFVKRVYIPLPDLNTRKDIIAKLLVKDKSPLSSYELEEIARRTDGYSGSDLAALAREAALMPLREYDSELLKSLPADKVRKLKLEDLVKSMDSIRPSVSKASLKQYENWNKDYGSL